MSERHSSLVARRLGWGLDVLGLVGLFASGMLVYSLLYKPLAERHAACGARIAELDKLVQLSEQVRTEHDKLASTLENLHRQAEALRKRIPAAANESEFLRQLTEAAQSSGVTLRNYRPGSVAQEGAYSRLDIQLQCAGPFPSIVRFLDRLASVERLYSVENLTISGEATSSNYPLDLTMMLYFETPAAETVKRGPV